MKRGRPLRRTPLARGTAQLSRKAPLRRVPLAVKTAATGKRRKPSPSPAKVAEFNPAVKLACRTRAGNGDPDEACCESCGVWVGRYGGIVQHRRARLSGGSRRPIIGSIVNAALQCGTVYTGCNGLAEGRDREMKAWGFVLEHGQDPAMTPIVLHSAGGSGIRVWLTRGGSYSVQAPVLERAS